MKFSEFEQRVREALQSLQQSVQEERADPDDSLENWIDELEVHLRAEE